MEVCESEDGCRPETQATIRNVSMGGSRKRLSSYSRVTNDMRWMRLQHSSQGFKSFTFNGRHSTTDNCGWVCILGLGVYGDGANRIWINPKDLLLGQRESVLKTRILRYLSSM